MDNQNRPGDKTVGRREMLKGAGFATAAAAGAIVGSDNAHAADDSTARAQKSIRHAGWIWHLVT